MGLSGKSGNEIDELIVRTQQRIDHLERLQMGVAHKQPLGVRFSNHLAKHGGHITNVVLAGCVLTVAWGQLQQKYNYQDELRAKDEQLQKLQMEKQRLEDRAGLLEQNIQQLVADVRLELDKGGWRLSPVAQRLRTLLHADTPVDAHHQQQQQPLPPSQATSNSLPQRTMI